MLVHEFDEFRWTTPKGGQSTAMTVVVHEIGKIEKVHSDGEAFTP